MSEFNRLKMNRTWLTDRSDAAAGVALILFFVAAFYLSSGMARIVQ